MDPTFPHRTPPATMRVAGSAGLAAFVQAHGGNSSRILEEVGIEPVELADPQAWMAIDRLGRLYEAAARELDDPHFGVHFGLTIPLHTYGVLSYVVLNAPTVETGVRNLLRLVRHLSAPAIEASLRIEGPTAVLEFANSTDQPDAYRHYIESTSAILWKVLQALSGASWKASEFHFRHGRGFGQRAVEVLLKAPVRFRRPSNRLIFPAEDLRVSVAGADRTLLPMLEIHVDEMLRQAHPHARNEPANQRAKIAPLDPLAFAVREQIARCLCDGSPNIQRVARKMGMSMRTLQRRLGERDLCFKSLVCETRHELACQYLANTDLSITELALLLGYSQLSVFDRAFFALEGLSPRKWRQRATLSGEPAPGFCQLERVVGKVAR